MTGTEASNADAMEIRGVRIFQESSGTYRFIVRHIGPFRLDDYEEIELEVNSARGVKKS